MRFPVRLSLVLAAIAFVAPTLDAQETRRREPPEVRMRLSDQARDSLEHRVRARMANILRTQLGLTDAQMARLRQSNERFEARRRELFQREREARGALREVMRSRDTTQQAQVGELLDRVVAVQRQRAELAEEEQRDLATFLTPMQRARYFGMEEQIRRRVEEMRERSPGDQTRRPGQASRRMIRPDSSR